MTRLGVQDAPQADGPRALPVNWVLLDSDWETGFCRVAESHSRVKAYVKNHNLGLEVPYRYGGVPAVDTLGTLGRWAFAELTEGGARAEREWRDLPR